MPRQVATAEETLACRDHRAGEHSRREALVSRISVIGAKRAATKQMLARITTDFTSRIARHDEDDDLDIQSEWAHGAEQTVGSVVAALAAQLEWSLDGETIDTARRAVIEEAGPLAECLSEIHAPYSNDLSGPDFNWTSEEIASAKAAGTRAEGNLESCISAVARATSKLDKHLVALLIDCMTVSEG